MIYYPSVDSKDKLYDLFDALRAVDVPKKVTYRYLAGIGFSSSNDRVFLPLLRFLGFIDAKGVPTDAYLTIRDETLFSNTLRVLVESAYAEVYDLMEGQNNVPENVLTGYFSRLTGRSSSESASYAKTLLFLQKLAGSESASAAVTETPTTKGQSPIQANVNLSINLPTTTDSKVYESLFKQLRDFLTPQV